MIIEKRIRTSRMDKQLFSSLGTCKTVLFDVAIFHYTLLLLIGAGNIYLHKLKEYVRFLKTSHVPQILS